MARKVLIQVRRGAEANIGTLEIGELGYCTDTSKLYVGTSLGNVLLVAAQTVGDMLKSIYDTNNDGIIDIAASVPWAGISGKPSTFTPTAHTHGAADINSGTVAAARLPEASASAAGIVQLNNTATSTSTTQAPTANALKSVADVANAKLGPGVTWNKLKGV